MDFYSIIQFAPFLIFIVIFVSVIYFANKKNKERIELLRQQIAPTLGLTFTEGEQKVKYSYNWHLSGTFQGCIVAIYITPERENKQTIEYTHFDVSIPTKRAYSLSISPEGLGTKLKKFFTRKEDLSSGDAEFDKMYLIESDSADQASMYLRNQEVRETINELFRLSMNTEIKNNTIMYSRSDLAMDAVSYKSTLDQLVKIAKKLGDKESAF